MKKEEVTSKRFLVLGAARSGIAAAKLLMANGANVILADSKTAAEAGSLATDLAEAGIAAVWGDTDIISRLPDTDIIVKSPGIPQTSPLVIAAREAHIRIISEIELASVFVPAGARIAAITGTNGKTTVTAWLTHVLAHCGFQSIAVGNIGDPWSAQVLTPPSDPSRCIYVVEVSSFQLEDVEDFRPDVALLTNITPDHMDRYEDRMDLYIAAKANIVRNMTADQVFIWNGNDTLSQSIAEKAKATSHIFSSKGERSALGESARIWVQDQQIFARDSTEPHPLLNVAHLPLPGEHNLENALAVIAAAQALGANLSSIVAGLKTFSAVEHRIEPCGTRPDGVVFYNDSKATNLDAMQKALVAFSQPIVLIAGGRDAHSDYASINHLVQKHVAHLITIGEAAPLIETAWGDLVPTRRAATMLEAVELADAAARADQVVVFSPACKSFDMYANFEDRGRDFKAKVAEVLRRY